MEIIFRILAIMAAIGLIYFIYRIMKDTQRRMNEGLVCSECYKKMKKLKQTEFALPDTFFEGDFEED